MAENYSSADRLSQPVAPAPAPAKPSAAHNIFIGPNGIRAGWRLAIFLALDFAFVYGIVHIPGVRSLLPPQKLFTKSLKSRPTTFSRRFDFGRSIVPLTRKSIAK